MSHLHLLQPLHGGVALPGSHVARRREAVDGADIDALDVQVASAGGWVERIAIESSTLGRQTPAYFTYYYVLPATAVAP
ncbi:hypothetical protein FSW04_05080 [Baekduia soli]|uniref:Uncharacterized protein n=1 Tax=Baekduia soli TaxID=496014 RepID=A0A5B8U1U9_9ACTN|nr:hypothetical protein [Baekduia soli]QEC47019.1 hypothetical protein FSW04_05080 [Baekduia soli]